MGILEAVLGFIWSLVKDTVQPAIAAAARRVYVPLRAWFSRLIAPLKWLVGGGLLIAVVLLVAIIITTAGVPVWTTTHDAWLSIWYSNVPPLSTTERARVESYAADWGRVLTDEYTRQIAFINTRTRPVTETSWTLSQEALALQNMTLARGVVNGRDLSTYVDSDVDSTCGCWRELNQPSSPRAVGITAWIIVSLEKAHAQAMPSHLKFLRDTQLKTGAWPMIPTDVVEEGSTFATPWVLLAMLNAEKGLEPAQQSAIAARMRQAVDWLLDQKPRDSLWQLYPQWQNSSAAQRISLSNSGLVIFALHQYDRAGIESGGDRVPERWHEKLVNADRQLLRALTLGIEPTRFESYDQHVMTSNDGYPTESIQLLVLPWLIIGSVDAYSDGTLRDRMKAIAFLNDVSTRLDEIDHEMREGENTWMIPEMLMALRYWLDRSYFSGKGGVELASTPQSAKINALTPGH